MFCDGSPSHVDRWLGYGGSLVSQAEDHCVGQKHQTCGNFCPTFWQNHPTSIKHPSFDRKTPLSVPLLFVMNFLDVTILVKHVLIIFSISSSTIYWSEIWTSEDYLGFLSPRLLVDYRWLSLIITEHQKTTLGSSHHGCSPFFAKNIYSTLSWTSSIA